MKTSKYNKTEGSFYDESGAKYTFERGQASAFWTPQKDYYPGLLGTISVDIDGDKGKNQNGYDIFYFSYNVKDKQYFSTPKGSIFSLLSCGYTIGFNIGFNIGFEEYKNIAYHKPGTYPDCQKDDDATCCGDIIMREGWQIKDDYPFKF